MAIYTHKENRLQDYGISNPVERKMTKKPPVRKLGIGMVTLNEWENEKDDNKWLSYSLEISYFDKKENKFKPTSNITYQQLHELGVLIDSMLTTRVGNRKGE